MAKKKAKQQKQAPVSPVKYMRTRVRQLPIEKCYVNENWQEAGMAYAFVIRRHTQGTHSFGMFLVDTWCRGIVDALYGVNVDDDGIKEIFEHFDAHFKMTEVDYALVHNIVYGALAFAEDAGIEPYKDFDVAQYILDEDTDDSPYIDIEFGKDGKYCLSLPDFKDANYYLKLLDKNVGPGNYHYILPQSNSKYNEGKDGVYKYFPTERPNADISTLHNKQIVDILSQDMCDITDEEVRGILELNPAELRSDLHKIIISTIHDNWAAIENDDESLNDLDYNLMPNSLRLLAEVADQSSVDVICELYRQSGKFFEFYFADSIEDFASPVIYRVFNNNLDKAFDLMTERGLDGLSRDSFMESLTNEMLVNAPDKLPELKALYADLFDYYLEHQDDKYLWNGEFVGILVSFAIDCGFKDLLPKIASLYETGYVDESVCGSLSEVEEAMTDDVSDNVSAYPLDIYVWLNDYKRIRKRH